MNKEKLAENIYEVSHKTGDFLLRSGKRSTEYFDKYQFESRPLILTAIAEQLKDLIPPDTELLAGLEMGGIPIATALSLICNKPVIFVRKEAKNYGTCRIAEGPDFKNKKVCLIEDVITTGGQVVESTKLLREQGAIVENVLCVIDRANGQHSKLDEINLQVQALFTKSYFDNL